LEQYASSGIEIAVLITKVNDNVVGYQGTKLGKDFLEKQTHYTESFRKFCRGKKNECDLSMHYLCCFISCLYIAGLSWL
jgi:hypothetical protein